MAGRLFGLFLVALAGVCAEEANDHPLIIEFNDETSHDIFTNPLRYHFVLFADPEHPGFSSEWAGLEAVAESFQDKILFIWIDSSDHEEFELILSHLHVTPEECPTGRLVKLGEHTDNDDVELFKFDHPKSLNPQDLEQYLTDALSGYIGGAIVEDNDPSRGHDEF